MKKFWSILLGVGVLAVVGVLFVQVMWAVNQKKATPNWELAASLNTRATNAQYYPSAAKLVGETTSELSTASGSYQQYRNGGAKFFENGSMSLSEYNKLINSAGKIDACYDREFNVDDAKDVVLYLSKNVGVFDTWFRLRGSHVKDKTAPKALSDGENYMMYDEDKESFKVIHVGQFQPWVYDSENDKFFWNETENARAPMNVNDKYKANWPVLESDVMVINYYYIGEGENRKEVVEVEIVQFIHIYNQTVTINYQCLKNIEDTSFTKYQINCAREISVPNNGQVAADYKNLMPNGGNNYFLQIDYTDKDNVSILELEYLDPNIVDVDGVWQYFEYNAIVNGETKKITNYSNYSSESAYTEIGAIQNSFNLLLNSITNSKAQSLTVDFTNADKIKVREDVFECLNSGISIAISNSYTKANFIEGLNIFDSACNNRLDVTDQINESN